MTIVRRIIAAAAVAGTLAVLPISVIATNNQTAAKVVVNGGQGSWPLGK
jgi:uncharacterized integral membrane protein